MSTDPFDGAVFGQYLLREQIGTGGMGVVYLADQPALKRKVAIKVLHNTNATDPQYGERFAREAQMAAALEHPHIVPVYDHGTTPEGVRYVVMRLLTGGALGQRLEQMKKREVLPSLTECSRLLRQMATALDYAHGRGLIHRDIKPNNIMFDEQGNAYLVDFGIARMNNQQTTASMTQTGAMVGTPAYMPPELWRGQDWTTASDQYSLGVVLYEMISGRPPFESNTLYGLISQHLNDLPASLPELRPDTPSQLTPVLERALSKDPGERYPNVTAFADAFEQAIRDAGMQDAQTTGFFTMPVGWGSHTPAGTLFTPRLTPSAPPAPRRTGLWLGIAAAMLVGVMVLAALLLSANARSSELQSTLVALEATQAANPALLTGDQLTATAVTCATVLGTPGGWKGQIAFESSRNGASNLYLMNADGTGITRLTDTTADDTNPVWSPDGLSLAFLSTRNGAEEIYLLTAEAGAPDSFSLRRLTESEAEEAAPSWSPDGQQLVFASQQGGNWDIYVVNVDGSNLRRLTDDPAADTEPVWSPDGTRIAFASERDGNGEIYVMDAGGSNLRRLTDTAANDGNSLVWSPEGSSIAYVAVEPDGNWEINTVGLEPDAKPQPFSGRAGDEWLPQWSPDGRTLAYIWQTDNVDLLAASADRSHLRNITAASSDDWTFTWSPDSAYLAYETDRNGDWEIYASDACGGDLRRLTNNSADDLFPAWRPLPGASGS